MVIDYLQMRHVRDLGSDGIWWPRHFKMTAA
jgi:hypothetical protein